jgi:hypothetical protein
MSGFPSHLTKEVVGYLCQITFDGRELGFNSPSLYCYHIGKRPEGSLALIFASKNSAKN